MRSWFLSWGSKSSKRCEKRYPVRSPELISLFWLWFSFGFLESKFPGCFSIEEELFLSWSLSSRKASGILELSPLLVVALSWYVLSLGRSLSLRSFSRIARLPALFDFIIRGWGISIRNLSRLVEVRLSRFLTCIDLILERDNLVGRPGYCWMKIREVIK